MILQLMQPVNWSVKPQTADETNTRLESDLWGNESPKCKHSRILVSIGVIYELF